MIRGNDSLVRGVELKVNLGSSGQTMTIRRPLQLIIPVELYIVVMKNPQIKRQKDNNQGEWQQLTQT